jgi:hypothetical protein
MVSRFYMPVILPPGRLSPATRPVGSAPPIEKTIEIELVAALAPNTVGVFVRHDSRDLAANRIVGQVRIQTIVREAVFNARFRPSTVAGFGQAVANFAASAVFERPGFEITDRRHWLPPPYR